MRFDSKHCFLISWTIQLHEEKESNLHHRHMWVPICLCIMMILTVPLVFGPLALHFLPFILSIPVQLWNLFSFWHSKVAGHVIVKPTASRYCPLWVFSFELPLKVFKTCLLERDFHTLIKNDSFSSPTDVVHTLIKNDWFSPPTNVGSDK